MVMDVARSRAQRHLKVFRNAVKVQMIVAYWTRSASVSPMRESFLLPPPMLSYSSLKRGFSRVNCVRDDATRAILLAHANSWPVVREKHSPKKRA
jgi:hypothetical protein